MGSPAASIAGGGSGGPSGGSGDVTGPASSTDNAVARFNGAGGKTLQDSNLAIDDTGNVSLPARILGKQGANVSSGTDLSLGSGNYFVVTGSTTIHGIATAGWSAGSVIVLQFNANVTVAHAGSPDEETPLALAGAANFSATAGDTLTLIYDATNAVWREIARSVI